VTYKPAHDGPSEDVTFSDKTKVAWPIVASIFVTAAPIIWMVSGMHRDVSSLAEAVKGMIARLENHGDRIIRLESR
jgi:hypothetical protein